VSTKIDAILFDLDGTLLDSRDAVLPAIEYALAQHGIAVPPREAMLPYSHSLRAVQEAIAPGVPYDELLASYDERLNKLLHTIAAYDSAAQVLGKLRRQYKIGMASSSRHAAAALERYGLREFFDVVVGALDTERHKPHPDSIEIALRKLSVAPERAVMVGDLAADVAAGHAAGVAATVGVTHGFGTREMLEAAGADYVIDGLSALPRVIAEI
jgi:pyrophosphatase PpaX